jgi:acyl carrier protein
MRGRTVADPFDAVRPGRPAADLGLIESVLRRAEGVRHVAVVWREDRLVAYVVPASADVTALRAHVVANVPGSPVPVFTMVDGLPLTANGRVDRAALSAPGYVVPAATGYVAPRTETERVLARVWADVLGVERVGIQDSFFDLTGDSIDTIRLVARAREAGLHITEQDVFKLKTVAAIAAAARSADPAAGPPDVTPGSALISLSQQEIDAIEAKWR